MSYHTYHAQHGHEERHFRGLRGCMGIHIHATVSTYGDGVWRCEAEGLERWKAPGRFADLAFSLKGCYMICI